MGDSLPDSGKMANLVEECNTKKGQAVFPLIPFPRDLFSEEVPPYLL